MPISILKLDVQQSSSLPEGINDTLTGISITKNIELTSGTFIPNSIIYNSLNILNESSINYNSLLINNTTGSLTSGEIVFKYNDSSQKNEILTLTTSTATYINRPFMSGQRGAYTKFGDGFNNSLNSLTIYDPVTSWDTISSSVFSASIIFTNNTLGTYIWSDNFNGTWGIGTTGSDQNYAPSKIIKSSNTIWDKINYGAQHVLAIKNNILFSWGYNVNGELGLGNNNDSHIPIQVGSTLWSDVSAGYSHSLALTTSGILYSWGDNFYGQLGLNNTTSYNTPQQVGSTVWSKIFASFNNSFIIRASDNMLFSFGNNNLGQLGIGLTAKSHFPVQVGSKNWITISNGPNHVFGIDTSNFLWAWGYNYAGRLGLGDTNNRHSPVQVGSSTWSQITALNSSAVGLLSNGTLYGWGDNYNSKLGINDPSDKHIPTQIGSTVWSKIYNSQYGYIVERSNDKQLFAVGTYLGSLVGYSGTEDTPKKINTVNENKKYEVGSNSVIFLNKNGFLFGWGENSSGELGLGITSVQNYPIQIGSTIWSDVSLSESSSFAIRDSDKALFSWGYNGFYAILGLNNNSNNSYHSPQLVSSTKWNKVITGFQHTLALSLNENLLYVWGANYYGQLGTGNTNNLHVPTQLGSTIWKDIFVGSSSSFIISALNDITYCFGDNYYGQLGLGNTDNYHVPTQLGSTIWSKIAVSNNTNHVAAIRNDGIGFVWGLNNKNNLGLGDADNRHSPTQIGSTIWSDVSVSESGCLFLRKSDGVVFVSGNDFNGSLGSGDYTKTYTTFTAIPGNWKKIISSKNNSIFIKDY